MYQTQLVSSTSLLTVLSIHYYVVIRSKVLRLAGCAPDAEHVVRIYQCRKPRSTDVPVEELRL